MKYITKLLITSSMTIALAGATPARANVNYDYATISAMIGAYGEEAATEQLSLESLNKIKDDYEYAEVATAGIFASKLLDRNALKTAKGFGDPDENYYYRKAYRLVANKIIPKTISVTEKLIKDPQTAIYWGSYLLRVMSDTKSLCNQFSAVVTNSTLNFGDVPFLEFTTTLKDVFNLTKLGDVDFETLFEDMANIGSTFSEENVKSELDNLQNLAVGLAGAGSATSDFATESIFNDTFKNNVSKVKDLAENYTDVYEQFQNSATGKLTSVLTGDETDITKVLTSSKTNKNDWISAYSSSGSDQRYYKRRVYIYYTESGSEDICTYDPPTDNDAILYGEHYTRFDTDQEYYTMTGEEYDKALQNSYTHAGWDQSKVDRMNAANDGYTYTLDYWSHSYSCFHTHNGNFNGYYAYAVAFSVHVRKSYSRKIIYDEDTFDSYSQDWTTFMNVMNAKLEEANRNEDGKVYKIGYDAKKYYYATNAKKLGGATTANFLLTCNSHGSIANGNIQYKCSDCKSAVNEDTRKCTMATTVRDEGYDYTEINNAISETEIELANLKGQINTLEAENRDILSQLSVVSGEEAVELRNQYNANKNKLDSLKTQYDEVETKLQGYKDAKSEAQVSEAEPSDQVNRIPSTMRDLKANFSLEWQDPGEWESYDTFVRHAKMQGLKSIVTFKARIYIARAPKYFLFIKIRRAIVGIDWSLEADYNDSSIIESMKLDPDEDSEAQAEKVNERLKQLQEDYPDCELEVQYDRTADIQQEDDEGVDDDKIHLLWASDRLDVAREIVHKLEVIYVDLVVLDKYMHYKYSILDWLKDQTVNRLDTDRGKRLTIAERCRRRWMFNGGSDAYRFEEEDDDYEEE